MLWSFRANSERRRSRLIPPTIRITLETIMGDMIPTASPGAVELTGAARTILCAVLVALISQSAHPAAQSS